MELTDELENMAVDAAHEEPEDESTRNPSQAKIKKFQERFDYSYEQAAALVGMAQTAKMPTQAPVMLTPAQARTVYAIRLEGPLNTPQKIQGAAGLTRIPEARQGKGEGSNAVFCKVDGKARLAILNWVSEQKLNLKPLFISEGKAYKELSSCSIYPTLGIDTTLPQYRTSKCHITCIDPTQHQYPVWYFFYGTLADTTKLSSVLSLSEDDETPELCPATIKGGKMKTWGNGKYNALVNGPETSSIKGFAYKVLSEEHEDSLRKYETDKYEVVRCLIVTEFCQVKGCTFRFLGETD